MEDKKKIALLEATLREMLRIDVESSKLTSQGTIAIDDALDGVLLTQWKNIKSRARCLLTA